MNLIERMEQLAESAGNVVVEEASPQDVKLAAAYFKSELVISDSIARAMHTPPGVAADRVLDSQPCLNWCTDDTKPSMLWADVGNSPSLITSAFSTTLHDGTATSCKRCSQKLYSMAEALEFHLRMLAAKARKEDAATLLCARRRASALRRLGIK